MTLMNRLVFRFRLWVARGVVARICANGMRVRVGCHMAPVPIMGLELTRFSLPSLQKVQVSVLR